MKNREKEVFAPQVRLEIPAGASLDQPVDAASHIMSQVAKTAPGIKCVLRAEAGNNWHLLGFDGRIDQLIIYMRPLPVAQKFTEAINKDFSLRNRTQCRNLKEKSYV